MENSLTASLTKLGNAKVEYKDKYDKSQLEPIPREPRRIGYSAPMNGADVWTCFEISFLLPNGLPWTGVLRISNPATSINIFESKSLKLYLNSFNNTTFESVEKALDLISFDLTELAGDFVSVKLVKSFGAETSAYSSALCLEKCYGDVTITEYTYNPKLLKTIEYPALTKGYYSDLLRSNCEITNQPDWGRVYIQYTSKDKHLDPRSLLQYLVSFRNHQEFHEPTCERIYNDIFELLDPQELTVICQYTRRGGIDINPIRTTNLEKVSELVANLPKLLQQ